MSQLTQLYNMKSILILTVDLGNNNVSILDFLCGSAGKESACSAGDLGSIPGLGRSPGDGKGYPLQYSGLYSPWGHKESDMTE